MGNYYLLNKKAGWAAVCISRNACTSLKKLTLAGIGIQKERKEDIHNAVGYSSQSSLLKAISTGRPENLFSFAVWRDPLDRFLSTYRHFALEKHPGRLNRLPPNIDAWITAAEEELRKPILEQDEHLRRQSDYYTPSDVDAIVALEDLNPWLLSRGGGNLEFQNRSSVDPPALSEEQESRIRTLYAHDWDIRPTVVMNHESALIQGMWVGDTLPPLAHLTIRSFLEHGFPFRLASYRDYPNLPREVEVFDANQIIPKDQIYIHPSGSLSPFGDWFRYRLLQELGGIWTDMDMACLRPFRLPAGIWFALDNLETASMGFMQMPSGHTICSLLGDLTEDPATIMPWDNDDERSKKDILRMRFRSPEERRMNVRWGDAGPWEFTRALQYFGLFHHAAQSQTVYPIPWGVWRHAYDGTETLGAKTLEKSFAIHLWGEMLRREHFDLRSVNPTSIVGELLKRHGNSLLDSCRADQESEAKPRPQILVGICSCVHYEDRMQAVRETWLSQEVNGVQALFFVGGSDGVTHVGGDVMHLPSPDTYERLPEKVLSFFKEALERFEFDWLFKCDDDTYVAMDRLHDILDPEFDLIGNELVESRGSPSGGAGYFLSREMVEKIVSDDTISPEGCEDVLIGEAAVRLGARTKATTRLCWDVSRSPHEDNDVVTSHWCSPARLRLIHAMRWGAPRVVSVTHPHWTDRLLLFPNGLFKRASTGCAGHWEAASDGGIKLDWFDWGAETLFPVQAGAVGSPPEAYCCHLA